MRIPLPSPSRPITARAAHHNLMLKLQKLKTSQHAAAGAPRTACLCLTCARSYACLVCPLFHYSHGIKPVSAAPSRQSTSHGATRMPAHSPSLSPPSSRAAPGSLPRCRPGTHSTQAGAVGRALLGCELCCTWAMWERWESQDRASSRWHWHLLLASPATPPLHDEHAESCLPINAVDVSSQDSACSMAFETCGGRESLANRNPSSQTAKLALLSARP